MRLKFTEYESTCVTCRHLALQRPETAAMMESLEMEGVGDKVGVGGDIWASDMGEESKVRVHSPASASGHFFPIPTEAHTQTSATRTPLTPRTDSLFSKSLNCKRPSTRDSRAGEGGRRNTSPCTSPGLNSSISSMSPTRKGGEGAVGTSPNGLSKRQLALQRETARIVKAGMISFIGSVC
jgi:hypothetical protein